MFANDRLEEVFGVRAGRCARQTQRGMAARRRPPRGSRPTTGACWRKTGSCEITETVPGRDGVPIDWLTLKFPIQQPDGKRWLGVVALDITARKRAEAEARAAPRQIAEEATPARRACSWPT